MSNLLTTTTADLANLGLTASEGDIYFDNTAKTLVVWDGSGWSTYDNDGVAQPYTNSYSVLFDGGDDHGFADLGFNANTLSAYTMSGFAKFHSFGSTKGPFGLTGSGSPFNSSTTRFDGATDFYWYHYGASSYTYVRYPIDITLQTGQWYHIAAVWDGTRIKVFLDGELKGTTENSITSAASGNMNIYVGRANAKMNCEVDEVAVWYTDESANMAQIRDAVTGMPKDLSKMTNKPAHWYRMGDAAGDLGTTTITDQGFDSSLVDLTLSGGAVIQTGAGKTPGS